MGLSRSAATVLAYAMKEFGWPLEQALRHVRRCRPGVLPNPGFMRQLDFYQGILSARWAGRAGGRGYTDHARSLDVGGAKLGHAPLAFGAPPSPAGAGGSG